MTNCLCGHTREAHRRNRQGDVVCLRCSCTDYEVPATRTGYLDPDDCYLAWVAACERSNQVAARRSALDLYYWLLSDETEPQWTEQAKLEFYRWCIGHRPWLEDNSQ